MCSILKWTSVFFDGFSSRWYDAESCGIVSTLIARLINANFHSAVFWKLIWHLWPRIHLIIILAVILPGWALDSLCGICEICSIQHAPWSHVLHLFQDFGFVHRWYFYMLPFARAEAKEEAWQCRPLRLTDETDEFISIMVRPKRPKMLMKLQEKPNLQRHQTFVRLDDLAEELAQVRGLSFKSSTCCRCWTSNIHHLSQATSWRQWLDRVDSSFGLWN